MPIYEYKCKKCGESFETLVRGNEKPVCPKCGSKSLEKQISQFAAKTDENYCAKPSCSCGSDCSGEHKHGAGCCCGHCCS